MVTTRQRLIYSLVWLLFFAPLSGFLYFVASSTCACGHGGMEPVLTVVLFGGFTVGGLACWARFFRGENFTGHRGLLASIAMMFVGLVAALLFAGGGDMQAQHEKMFQPVDPAQVGDVEF